MAAFKARRDMGVASLMVHRFQIPDVSKPDLRTALQNLAIAFDRYNESHPHSAL
jgi:transposase InsO family protein